MTMDKYISPAALVMATLTLAETMPKEPQPVPFLNKKQIVKRDATPKPKRPGRGRPAKGYDLVTGTWSKPGDVEADAQ
jgi:hypothetical protein